MMIGPCSLIFHIQWEDQGGYSFPWGGHHPVCFCEKRKLLCFKIIVRTSSIFLFCLFAPRHRKLKNKTKNQQQLRANSTTTMLSHVEY